MFENLREAIRDLASGAVPPAQRSAAIAHMRATLVQARVGLADIAAARDKTRALLEAETRELETVRRRKGQAESIADAETAGIATSFEEKHAQRVAILTRKLAVQEDELTLAESELEGMTAALRQAALAAGSHAQPSPQSRANAEANDLLNEEENLRRDLDGLVRQRSRESQAAQAEQKLADLKRRMAGEE